MSDFELTENSAFEYSKGYSYQAEITYLGKEDMIAGIYENGKLIKEIPIVTGDVIDISGLKGNVRIEEIIIGVNNVN